MADKKVLEDDATDEVHQRLLIWNKRVADYAAQRGQDEKAAFRTGFMLSLSADDLDVLENSVLARTTLCLSLAEAVAVDKTNVSFLEAEFTSWASNMRMAVVLLKLTLMGGLEPVDAAADILTDAFAWRKTDRFNDVVETLIDE